ncbi:cyclin-H-like [Ostrea edulis]|uniref:cyclin-H-like n=1 Tax=Ostrea edulis TaxID=37623 RepID=UPI00209462FC|nr:cyclin-H-like [Ostrea edulis]XP_048750257.1 cyclin-H-like [Ostrea edulis]
MFATSSQLKHWMFNDETDIQSLRHDTNQKFVERHGARMSEEQRRAHFLTSSEERHLCRHFEYVLKEFCSRFHPPMPKYVLGTALCYFKRFYINCSAMDYHPRDIMLTCVYLASKVEEFNVSITQFVGNLKGDREKFANTILTFELLLMDKLNYHLLIHNPYRPMEGLFIDLKTRFRVLENPEKLRKAAEEFLDKSLMTDVCLLFPPSQVALTAVLVSAAKEKANLDRYVAETLLKGMSSEEIKKLQLQIKKLRHMVKSQEQISREQMTHLQRKLDTCRNPENNPESEVYKRKLQDMLEEDDEIQTKKRKKISEEQRRRDEELLSMP